MTGARTTTNGRRPEGLPSATVVVVTRNRAAELRSALDSCLAQSVALELIVIDDASSDDTVATLRRHYPSVRLETAATRIGYIRARNLAAKLATTPRSLRELRRAPPCVLGPDGVPCRP